MKRLFAAININAALLKIGVWMIVIILGAVVWIFSDGNQAPAGMQIGYWGIVLILAIVMTLIMGMVQKRQIENEEFINKETEYQIQQASLNKRLDGMVRLNRLLIDSENEKALVEKALEIITEVVDSAGASFVPFDEWGQPIRSYVFGNYPVPVMKAWSEHLTAPEIRDRCQACTQLRGNMDNGCPLLAAPFSDIIRIYCLPINRNSQSVGIVNLYLRADQEITPDIQEFLAILLDEMALAIEVTRLRNQELITLRQLQLVHSQQEELSTIVTKLIDGLRDVLDFKCSRAIFRAAEPRLTGFELVRGDDPWLITEEATQLLQELTNKGTTARVPLVMRPQTDGSGILLLPFSLPEGTIIGAVLLTGARFDELQPRQSALIETVTTQVALLVENERRRLETEYRTVIQERVRLAREIHDSLAQTLAYLKLNSAQMQSQLAQGDLTRLSQSLQHSHEALSEAYLETRQVIDNLRFAPQLDMVSWLSQITQNFEKTSGLKVTSSLPERVPQLSPEVQAQLVRIIQEALSNIRKHAQAKSVMIKLREWNNDLLIDIQDDGIGFSAEDIPDLSRHGLRGMRERAELIGAEFQITSQIDRGTTIHIEVPINIQEAPV